ncbi:MAG: hypothetical protein KKF27_21490 [Gammaproteobacteria bacterium]|nr:hypothetical protein [Gammaproteobacteria bacterium]
MELISSNRQEVRAEFDKRAEYEKLNLLLAQKHQIDEKIADLHQQIAVLRKKGSELDEEFHREVIMVRPTITEPSKEKKKPTDTALLKAILKAAEEHPEIMTQIQDRLSL